MGLRRFDYTCDKCEITEERVVTGNDKIQRCIKCRSQMRQEVPLFSVVGAFKMGWKYDWGAGRKFYSSKEKDRWLKENGLTIISDVRPPRYKRPESKEVTMDEVKKLME